MLDHRRHFHSAPPPPPHAPSTLLPVKNQ
jgi:hypothetical protein